MAWALIEAMHHVCIVFHALLLQLLLTFILCCHLCGRSASVIASAFVWFNTGIHVYDWVRVANGVIWTMSGVMAVHVLLCTLFPMARLL